MEYGAKQANRQCPIHPDEFTTIQSVFMVGKKYNTKIIIDDAVIDYFSAEQYKEKMLQDFVSLRSRADIRELGRCFKEAGITMNYYFYTPSNDLYCSVELTGDDLINY